jgi:penicillin-binding protein 2
MFRFRVRVVLILVFGGFLMVSTRLFYLQVIRGEYYRDYAENVREDTRSTEASRGGIFAAGGERLAYDAASFNLALVPNQLPEWQEVCRPILKLYRLGRDEKVVSVRDIAVLVSEGPKGEGYQVNLGSAATFLRKKGTELVPTEEQGVVDIAVPPKLAQWVDQVAAVTKMPAKDMLQDLFEGIALVGRGWRRLSEPCVVARDLDFLAAAEIETHPDRYPGACIVASAKRSYPYDGLACHVLGHMGRVTATEYSRWCESYAGMTAKRLLPDDLIGRAGVERSFDGVMRPARGEETVEVDAGRHTQRVLSEVPPEQGAEVHLTIDVEVQRAAEEALRDRIGAVIVLEPRTGRILAMASSPAFNPNSPPRIVRTDPQYLLAPMLNRAIQARYALGSAFKLLLAIAALEEGRAFREVVCTGEYHGQVCANHSHPMTVDLHNAIVRSCNVYFYRTGQEGLGITLLAKWGALFGFGQPTGISLPGEDMGLMPTPAWKLRNPHFRERWYDGDTRNLAIGQGYLLVTPIQVVRYVAAIANGGRLVTPRLVDRIVRADGTVDADADAGEATQLPVTPARLAQVVRAMRAVCHEMGGTGRRAWLGWVEEMGYFVAGKTSTAEFWVRRELANLGWFVGFAPADDPRVAFVVVLEHERSHVHGADVAAPAARYVLSRLPERYLQGIPGRDLREQRRQHLTMSGGGR